MAFVAPFLRLPTTTVKRVSTRARFSMYSKSIFDKPTEISEAMPAYDGFDPLGFSGFLSVPWLQEAELKHGRICMLAFLGIVVNEFFTFPFYSGAPELWTEKHNWAVTQGSLPQILLWAGFFELMTMVAVVQTGRGKMDRIPGDFGLDPLGLAKSDPKARDKEVRNGRLAMLALAGLYLQSIVTGLNPIQQLAKGNILPPIL